MLERSQKTGEQDHNISSSSSQVQDLLKSDFIDIFAQARRTFAPASNEGEQNGHCSNGMVEAGEDGFR